MPVLKSMMHLSTLLGFASLGEDVLKARIMRRLMKDIASVVALAVATGFVAGALLIGLACLAYQELIRSGISSAGAISVLIITGTCIVIYFIRVTRHKLQQLKHLRSQNFSGADLQDRVFLLLDNFIDGFIQQSKAR